MGEEVDLGGGYLLARILKSGIKDTRDANQALLDEFKIQEDVEMYIQLPEYYDFRGFDRPIETDSAVIPKRVFGLFPKHTWSALKRHLFNTFAPKILLRALRALFAKYKKRMNLSKTESFGE